MSQQFSNDAVLERTMKAITDMQHEACRSKDYLAAGVLQTLIEKIEEYLRYLEIETAVLKKQNDLKNR